MSTAVGPYDDDNKILLQEPLTHPPLLDKHFQFDMFSIAETKRNDANSCPTPPKGNDEPTQDVQNQLPKKIEPVLGKERAIKILKAFGSQQKPVKEFHTNVLKTPTKDNNKPKREKKSLTPMEKAKETISQIEELKKFKDRTIPTYFGENVVIHHIKADSAIETKTDNIKSECVDRAKNDFVGAKITIDSLEALKVYNNQDVDKQSDDDMASEKEENWMYESMSIKKRKLPTEFDVKAKRSKDKRSKRNSLDSRSSDKKRKRRNKDRKSKKSRDSSSRRSSMNSSKKRSKRKRDSNRDTEISSDKQILNSLESQGSDYQFERYTKTLPAIKYSANPTVMRELLTNGIANKGLKKKKRSSSKSTLEKEKRKKSSDRSAEKGKAKNRRSSGSKADKYASKKRRKELEKSFENIIPKIEKETLSADVALEENANNVDEKSAHNEEYQSKWDDWDATDEMAGNGMENLLPLDTIPLQLNVPKQDRTILFINNSRTSEYFNQTTPKMKRCDPPVETPIILDVTAVKDQQSVLKDLENGKLCDPMTRVASKVSSDDVLEKYISKLSPNRKKNENAKSNHQPVAQLYDEYEQFLMCCMPSSDENNHNNGDKSSVTSSLFDETVTSNDGDEELQALKISLEKKLHAIEHTDSEDAAKVKVSDQSIQSVNIIPLKPPFIITKESTDTSSSSSSSSSSDSSSSSTSSPSREKRRKKKNRKHNANPNMTLSIDDSLFNLKTGIEDDELSDNELLSKVEQLKQQFSEKRKALADKRKLAANDSGSPDNVSHKSDVSDALLVSPEKRSAISLKIGSNKPNSIMKPVMLDDDDFTEKLLLEVTPHSLARSKETNKLLTERVIGTDVRSSNNNLLSGGSFNHKVYRIAMIPNNPIVPDIFPRSKNSVPIENAILKINLNESAPVETSEKKNSLNNAVSHFNSSESIASKTSGSIERNVSCDLSPGAMRKVSPKRPLTPPSRSDKRDSCDYNSKSRPLSPYHRSHTKESSKRHSSPQPLRHRSPRSRKRTSHRSPSPIRKRSRGSPRRSRSPRKSPRRLSPRRIRRSLSPRSKRDVSPIRGRPRTPPMPDKHTNRKWEPPHMDYKSSVKSTLACDNNVPQPICRLESTHSTPWPAEGNSAFAQYDYQQPIRPLSPKRSVDARIAHSFNHPDQSYDFHQASGPYMGHFPYSTENKIPVLNSQENYYFQPHLPSQNIQALPPQPIPTQHVPRQHVPVLHVQHMAPNQLSPQPLTVQHVQQRTFPNLIEIRQSNVDVEPTPFVVKGNVLEIVPSTEAVVAEKLIDSASLKVEDDIYYEDKQEVKIELTEEEIERRELKKAELKLKRKQERDKRQLERFMRKEKLKLEIKHLMEVGVHTAEIKKATYNPNAVGGKSILRINASSLNKKSVLFADGVAPGDGTSTSGGEDVVPLLRDRNKRMTKRKLDSKRRRARREASVIKKEAAPQVLEITPFIDPELENMPPPLPPDGNPSARLKQPKLKATPKLIYFHYDPRSNSMYVSPFSTDLHIPRELDQPFLAITRPSIDSPSASSTPDLIQKPKVCFIHPPVFEQQPTHLQGANQSVPNANHNALILNNSIGSAESPLLPIKSLNQPHQQPSSNSLPTSPALYPSRQTHSLSPQNYRGPVPINQQSVSLQPSPMQIQASPMTPQWENSPYQTSPQVPPLQQPPCRQSWEPDAYPHSQPVLRPHTRFNNVNKMAPQRPNNPWDQQRHPNPIFQNQVHPPHQPPPFHPRSNHPRFHQNPPINVNPSHQQHNNFAFNANYNNYNANPNQSWNHQYRNNH